MSANPDLSFIAKAVDAGAAAGQRFGFEKAKLQIVLLLIEEMEATKDVERSLALTTLIGKVQLLKDDQP